MHPEGKKQVREAVIIAALSALATGLVNTALHYGSQAIERERKRRKKKRRKAKKEDDNGKAPV